MLTGNLYYLVYDIHPAIITEESGLNAGYYTGLDMRRDIEGAEYHDFAKIQEGGICPHCGKPAITVFCGIEVGNIFQLGTKYTKSMNMTYIDANGEAQHPVMGCSRMQILLVYHSE